LLLVAEPKAFCVHPERGGRGLGPLEALPPDACGAAIMEFYANQRVHALH